MVAPILRQQIVRANFWQVDEKRRFTAIQLLEQQQKGKKRWTPGLPAWSPTAVLTMLDFGDRTGTGILTVVWPIPSNQPTRRQIRAHVYDFNSTPSNQSDLNHWMANTRNIVPFPKWCNWTTCVYRCEYIASYVVHWKNELFVVRLVRIPK